MTGKRTAGDLPLRRSLPSEPTGPEEAQDDSNGQWAFCAVCGLGTAKAVYIGSIEVTSGPGHALYADPACARAYANTSEAPEWLRERFARAAA